jgi:adenylate kinase
MLFVMLGAPGVGKGTQSKRLIEHLSIPHVSTGEILRSEIAAGSSIGRQVEDLLAAGHLVPDELMNEIVRRRLVQPDCQRGCLLDGYPRTIEQAAALDEFLKEIGRPLDAVILIVCDENELITRLLGRAALEGRNDDTPEAIAERLRIYHEQTEPLIDYYRRTGVLREIDGMGAPDDVFRQITSSLVR